VTAPVPSLVKGGGRL